MPNFPFTNNFFNESANPERTEPLKADTDADVIIVGAGIVGLTSAYTLRKAGLDVALVEREHVGIYEDADQRGVVSRMHMYIETLPNGTRHHILERSDREQFDDTREFVVPPDHFFAMGDNRDNSQDSRVMSSVGFVPMENLVGRAELMFFSIDDRKGLLFGIPNGIRWSRIFNTISP